MLEIKNLCKSFKRKLVLNDLNLSIDDGEIFGFVGPNGAGKTTTMRIVAGLLMPDSGSVVLDGIDAITQADKMKKLIGYMPDFFGTYPNLKTSQYMEYFTSLYGICGNEVEKRCDELLELVNLADKKNVYVDDMSRGMKQRLCLARCLIHDPKLLILDEPASGLDPRARFEMKEIMRTLRQMEKTVIISSHILPELAQMTSTIGIIENGKIIAKGTMDNILTSLNKKSRIHIVIVENNDDIIKILKNDSKISNISINENVYSFNYDGSEKEIALVIKKLVDAGILISEITRESGNLEEVFMEITKRED